MPPMAVTSNNPNIISITPMSLIKKIDVDNIITLAMLAINTCAIISNLFVIFIIVTNTMFDAIINTTYGFNTVGIVPVHTLYIGINNAIVYPYLISMFLHVNNSIPTSTIDLIVMSTNPNDIIIKDNSKLALVSFSVLLNLSPISINIGD